jgi:probable rRNA maturation factor
MIEVEVFGESGGASASPSAEEVRDLCVMVAASAGIQGGHVAVEFVDAGRIARLNAVHRSHPRPTDVLSFPIDGAEARADEDASGHPGPNGDFESAGGARELGDVVICPEHTVDVREAVVHGMLHLLGMDHETDDGEMLALQRALLARETG